MPSFDVISEVDAHELTNAVDQANRELTNRFDFKGVDARIERKDNELTIVAPSEFQVHQVRDILHSKLAKREIDITSLEPGDISSNLAEAKQVIAVKQGIDKDTAKKIVKISKASKLKIQAAIQGEQVRITGKKRDDLQSMMAELKKAELGLPLQFNNFRD
ncbi:MAG TPA: YajQ family cyclic di-GMP-binding protein [Chromatiaceae bacterium]|jgi:uncharacterized protein YajQ (UPF0234 family)|nr:YajQ family cyclic di-GMP-binding protein [Chromatiaceae bacterium]HIA08753.1 YajQ family cyclic di-GMP-binding protein [Chromatiaceae bacterium]HIN82432.1 YajQ family cyclic di-GMP-binding protein [Chromatiales bacterium]HIO54210.1 YajQ family cyclic di-GMP-binding protein [Chromatiales bacterium]